MTKKSSVKNEHQEEKIINQLFEEEMSKSYVDYAMSVIASRALPDVRDGLKPVQRRILHDMYNINNYYDKPYRKSAKVVGDTMARFHSHGDSSIYGALVHMSQDWVYNHPLVDKHGNFGSIEGDGAAAMRYCVTGDTLINTDKGLIRIDEIVPNTKNNSDNPIKIKVKSLNGSINHSNMLFNSSYQKIYRIILKNGMEISVSDNHPILVEVNKRYKWIVAKNLKKNMNCVIDTCIDNAMFGTNDNYHQAQKLANKCIKNYVNKIPSKVFTGNQTYLLTFIKTIFKNNTKFMSISKTIVQQLQILMATQLGILSNIVLDSSTNKYILTIEKQNEKYSTSAIKYIYKEKEKKVVYSIKVLSNCHSFTGNGFINHNTEARLSKITQDTLLSDLGEGIVDYKPNFDDTEKEPTVLPAKIPNLLIQGSEGIAVGMACSIPSHNLGEVIDAVKYMLSNKKATLYEVLEFIQGPDFATGGIISNKKDLYDIYKTGTGKIRIRGKVEIEEKNGKPLIVITEIPATMIGAIEKFMTSVADLVRDKKAPEITDISNLSSKEGIKIVVELKKGANIQNNINILYKKAKLEDTFSFNMLAIKNQSPSVYSLIDYLKEFIEFQIEIYTKKYNHLLQKQQIEKEKKEGLVKAIDCIDLIIEILRGSKTKKDAKDCLVNGNISNITFKSTKSEKLASKLKFSDLQADCVLLMPLQSLIGLELDALLKELDKCNKNIEEYNGYLNNPVKMKNKIKSELELIKKNYEIPRKTLISDEKEIILEKQDIVEQDYYILIDRFRYVKLIDSSTYERNIESIPSDFKYCIKISNIDKLFIFTNTGKCHKIKTLDIPLCKYKEKGIPLENISNLLSQENIIYISSGKQILSNKLIFVTTKGYVKIVDGNEFESTTKTIVATKLPENTELLSIFNYNKEEIVLCTNNGYFIRFKTSDISEMKKTSNGVRGIKLKEKDYVNKCFIGDSKDNFIIDETEYPFSKIKISKRDGIGTKTKF